MVEFNYLSPAVAVFGHVKGIHRANRYAFLLIAVRTECALVRFYLTELPIAFHANGGD
jgi:hypothetical protein